MSEWGRGRSDVRRRVSGKHSQRTRVEYWIRKRLHKAEEGNTITGRSIIRGGECLDVRPSHPPHPFIDHLVFLVNFPPLLGPYIKFSQLFCPCRSVCERYEVSEVMELVTRAVELRAA
jgi:hypothetical protein